MIFRYTQHGLFFAVVSFFSVLTSYSADLIGDFADENPPVLQKPDNTDADILNSFSQAFTFRLFEKKATLKDQKNFLALLKKDPASESLLSFLIYSFNGKDAPDEIFVSMRELAKKNPHAGLLNLAVGDMLSSKKEKETSEEREKRLSDAAFFLHDAYHVLVLKEEQKQSVSSKVFAAAAKYMMICLLRKDFTELDSVMADLRKRPQFYDTAEILSPLLLVSAARQEILGPILFTPFGPVPDESFRVNSVFHADAVHFLHLLANGKFKGIRQAGRAIGLLEKKGYSGQIQEALLDWILHSNGEDAEPIELLAAVKQKSGHLAEAIRLAELALNKMFHPNPRLILATVELCRNADDTDKAFLLLDRYQKHLDKHISAEQYIQLYLKKHDLNAALKMTDRMKEGFEKYIDKTVILKELERWKDASAAADKASVFLKKNKIQLKENTFYLVQAEIEEKLGNIQKVKAILEPLIAAAPKNAFLLNFLGYVLADHNMELEYAQSLIERALHIEPQSAAILDSMAWVLYRRGKYKEAEQYIAKSLKASGNHSDSTILDHAGEILFALHDREKAVRYWKLALQQLKDNASDRELRIEIQKKISGAEENR